MVTTYVFVEKCGKLYLNYPCSYFLPDALDNDLILRIKIHGHCKETIKVNGYTCMFFSKHTSTVIVCNQGRSNLFQMGATFKGGRNSFEILVMALMKWEHIPLGKRFLPQNCIHLP